MSTRRWLLLAAAVLALAVLVSLLAPRGEHSTETYLGPARGEAASNRYFVLARSLEHAGQPVRVQRYPGDLPQRLQPGDTVLLAQHERGLDPDQRAGLVAFVTAGGHLVLPVARSGQRNVPSPSPLLADFGLQANRPCERRAGRRCPLAVTAAPGRLLVDAPDHLRVRHGQGTLDLVASLEPLQTGSRVRRPQHADIRAWRQDGLASAEHQQRAWHWLSPNWDRGTFYLVHGLRHDRWWMALLRAHWPVALPLALLLGGLLWAASQRLGPRRPDPQPVRRSLREHVAATSALLWRHRRGIVLYDAARQALQQQLQLHVPALAGLHDMALEQGLARHLGWPPDHVAQALRRPPPNDTRALQRRISLLMDMRNQL